MTSKSGPSPKSMIAQHMIADSLLGRGRMISPLVMPSTYKRSYWENRVVRLGWDLGPATHRRRRRVVLRLTYHCDTFHRLWQLTDDLWWRPHCNSIRRLSDKQSAVDPSSTFVPNQVTDVLAIQFRTIQPLAVWWSLPCRNCSRLQGVLR